MHRSKVLAILAVVHPLWCTAVATSQTPESQAASSNSAQVRQWAHDLNSDSFIQREVATAKLIDAGADSIEPLVIALMENNLEVTTRAIYVLRELALSGDPELEEAARKTLEETAQPRGTSAARRARETLAKLDLIRQDRALDALRKLGAVIVERQPSPAFGVVARYSIEIGAAWRGQTDDLRRLRHIKDVGELMLEGDRVADEWLSHIPKTDGPSALTIKRANVTDDGIKHLAGMKGLQLLSLLYIPVTDHSVLHLQEIAGVTTMRIYGSRMTRDGADRLREVLAGTQIDFRQGGFLGIGCQPDENGCVIYTVRANTAAHKGGLQTKDVIYEYQGKKVTDFEQLTALISENEAGDTVTIKVLRRGQKLEKHITLGQWD